MASKASTIGYVAGAAPPSYAPTVAATNARTAASVTSCGWVGGNARPTSDWSTGMDPNIDVDPPERLGRVDVEDAGGDRGQRVSRCIVCLRSRGQNFMSSMRSGSLRRFFLVM